MKRITLAGMTLLALTVLTAIGCSPAPDTRDARLTRVVEESMARQQEQNQYIAKQSEAIITETQRLVDASKELVATDAKTRQELLAAQDRLNTQLNAQRAAITDAQDQLEEERRLIAQQRHRDPIIANSIQTIGLVLACLLPLGVCGLVVWRLGQSEPNDAAVAELLVAELTADRPMLLPGPVLRAAPALEHHAGPRLPGSEASDDQTDATDMPF